MNQGGKGGGGRYDDDDVTLSPEVAVYSLVVYSFLADSAVAEAPLVVVLPVVADSVDLVAAVLLVVAEPVVAGNKYYNSR